MPQPPGGTPPSPELFFQTVQSYQRTAVLRAAIELDVFSAIARGARSSEQIAAACASDPRGTRILCDYLTVIGFLEKDASAAYALTPDSALFLDRESEAYLGGTLEFLLSPDITVRFHDVVGMVRRGGAAPDGENAVTPDWPTWVRFARAMAPMMALPAERIADVITERNGAPKRVLDVAAGHGLFGIAFARRHPETRIVALDWEPVLAVAKENALAAGVTSRYETIAGSAFEVDPGSGYDLILLTNLLHHFDAPTCEGLLRRLRDALAPGGSVVTLEFVPDENRVSPALPAMFAMQMLAMTPGGDAYTFGDLERMFRNAGYTESTLLPLPPTVQSLVVSTAGHS